MPDLWPISWGFDGNVLDSPWPHVLFILLERGSTTERDLARTKTCDETSSAHADQTQALLLLIKKQTEQRFRKQKSLTHRDLVDQLRAHHNRADSLESPGFVLEIPHSLFLPLRLPQPGRPSL